MAYNGQWGTTDNASNSVLWGVVAAAAGKAAANGTNQTAFFDNVSRGVWVSNQIVGQFGVSTDEAAVKAAPVVHITVTNNGSGYAANTANTALSATNGGSGAYAKGVANTTGRIASVTVTASGNNYITNPTFTVPAPTAVTFNGNTAVTVGNSTVSSYITTASAPYFLVGDKVVYAGNVSSTPAGLVDTTTYFISFANATVVSLAATSGGAGINFTGAPYISAIAGGATITGETATAVAVAGGSKGLAHSGWVVRKVGTGGRAGRVTYETLVATGTITGDADGSQILPNS